MNQPIYGCAGCNTTAGAGGCPVHRSVNAPPSEMVPQGQRPTDWYGHWSTAQLALKAVTEERDKLLLQVRELMDFIASVRNWGRGREDFVPLLPRANDLVERFGFTEKHTCHAPMPFGQSGVPDFCGKPMPCEDHKTEKRKPETQQTREREDGFHGNLC